MFYIFMDESGCLGFDSSKIGTSKNFIISFLLTPNKRPIEKIVKKAFRNMPAKDKKGHPGVLHATKEKLLVIKRVMEDLTTLNDVKVMYLRLNKERVYTHLRDEKQVIYNFVTNILLDRLLNKGLCLKGSQITLIASRRETNKILNEQFQGYTHTKVRNNHGLHINVDIKTPSQEKGLQVVDFVSWSCFRKYEHCDSRFYDIISNLIIEDKVLFE